jgi:hypothetical protein
LQPKIGIKRFWTRSRVCNESKAAADSIHAGAKARAAMKKSAKVFEDEPGADLRILKKMVSEK